MPTITHTQVYDATVTYTNDYVLTVEQAAAFNALTDDEARERFLSEVDEVDCTETEVEVSHNELLSENFVAERLHVL